MASADLPPDVACFLTTYVESAADLEVLLYLHARPLAEWGVRAVVEVLDLDLADAEAALSHLQQKGLLAMRDSPSRLYQYRPRTPALAASVDRLAVASAQRRFAVVALILSNRTNRRLRLFSGPFALILYGIWDTNRSQS